MEHPLRLGLLTIIYVRIHVVPYLFICMCLQKNVLLHFEIVASSSLSWAWNWQNYFYIMHFGKQAMPNQSNLSNLCMYFNCLCTVRAWLLLLGLRVYYAEIEKGMPSHWRVRSFYFWGWTQVTHRAQGQVEESTKWWNVCGRYWRLSGWSSQLPRKFHLHPFRYKHTRTISHLIYARK